MRALVCNCRWTTWVLWLCGFFSRCLKWLLHVLSTHVSMQYLNFKHAHLWALSWQVSQASCYSLKCFVWAHTCAFVVWNIAGRWSRGSSPCGVLNWWRFIWILPLFCPNNKIHQCKILYYLYIIKLLNYIVLL